MSARGTYNTRQKGRVLAYLSAHKGERLTVEQVTEHLAQSAQPVGKTTVYRQLEALVGQGAVHKYLCAEGGICYQYYEGQQSCEEHAHLVCIDCGQLQHLDCSLLQTLQGHMKAEHEFALDTQKTVLYGQCADCVRAKKGS